MIRSLNSLLEVLNSNSVQNVNIGSKESKDVVLCHAGVVMSFAMIVEEVIVLMECVRILHLVEAEVEYFPYSVGEGEDDTSYGLILKLIQEYVCIDFSFF